MRCRAFECRQLQRVATGEITETAAQENIGHAVMLVAEVDTLLLRSGATNMKHPLSKRCETAMAEPLDPSSDEAVIQTRAQLSRAMKELDALQDREFRVGPEESPE